MRTEPRHLGENASLGAKLTRCLFRHKCERATPEEGWRRGLRERFSHGSLRWRCEVTVLFGPVYDPVTPRWKNVAFLGFILIAALALYVGRSRPQRQFMTALLLAVIVVLFVLVTYVFH